MGRSIPYIVENKNCSTTQPSIYGAYDMGIVTLPVRFK
jgi:hypothetical protein